MGLLLTNKKRNYTSMNNVWSTLLGLVAELNINKKSKKEVTDLREESDGDRFGHLPFTWKTWKFRLEKQKVRAIPFGKLQKIWAADDLRRCSFSTLF